MERLTKHWGNNYVPTKLDYEILFGMTDEQAEYLQEIVKKLATYEDAKEQGLLVRLPCNVGDTVYWVSSHYGFGDNFEVSEEIVEEFVITETEIVIHMATTDIKYGILGENVFLTKEEAEAKLKEME